MYSLTKLKLLLNHIKCHNIKLLINYNLTLIEKNNFMAFKFQIRVNLFFSLFKKTVQLISSSYTKMFFIISSYLLFSIWVYAISFAFICPNWLFITISLWFFIYLSILSRSFSLNLYSFKFPFSVNSSNSLSIASFCNKKLPKMYSNSFCFFSIFYN